MMLERMVNAVGGAWDGWWGRRAPEGRVYAFDHHVDSLRSTLTKKLTFAKLESILTAGDDGDITDTLCLFDEMERRDLRLKSVAGTRRKALSGLDWEIVSAAEKQKEGIDKALADEVAIFCREELSGIPATRAALRHQSTAIGPNLAVTELVWEFGGLVDLEPIPNRRLTMDTTKSLDIRVITKDEPLGIVAAPPKFVVHIPDAKSGSPLADSLLRAQATLWLVKKLALADWGAFIEIFGMPVRVGKYQPGTSKEEKRELAKMLAGMSSKAWMMCSTAVELVFQESSQRGTSPHEALMNYCSRETSIGWIGANLPTDTTGGTGTYAAAAVQEDVREDLRDDDIECEGNTIREQILRPMVAFKWPGRDVPVPYFERVKPEQVEPENVAAWQNTGLTVGEDWARRISGIPKPGKDEAVLRRLDAFEEGLNENV